MNKLYCLSCPTGCLLTIVGSGANMVVEGGQCPKGQEFAEEELKNTNRTLATTVRTSFPDVPVISVRTDGEIPKDCIFEAMSEINKIIVEEELGIGDILIDDVADTGVSVIVTSPALMQLGAELENKNEQISRVGASKNTDSPGTPQGGAGEGVLDDFGEDHVGGFIGAAGEAVGVEDPDEEDAADETEAADDKNESKELLTRHSRARIRG